MGKLYVPSQNRTSIDTIRQDLAQAEETISDLEEAGNEALALAHLFDRIERRLQELDAFDVDLRVEQTRFETVQRKLRRRQRRFLSQVGRALKAERQEIEPPRSHWWWYLDESAARERRRRWLRVGAGAAAVVVLLAGLWLAYRRYLAPDPSVTEAYRRIQAGMTEAEEGRTQSALADFEVAVDLTPADPEPWLWKGVLHDQLGEASEADDAFEQAESVYGSPLDFLLNRGRVYLQVGDVGKAQADIDAAIDLDPASGWAHYLQAGVAMRKDDYTTALAELDRALELARESGDSELQVMAASQKARLAQLQPSDSD